MAKKAIVSIDYSDGGINLYNRPNPPVREYVVKYHPPIPDFIGDCRVYKPLVLITGNEEFGLNYLNAHLLRLMKEHPDYSIEIKNGNGVYTFSQSEIQTLQSLIEQHDSK